MKFPYNHSVLSQPEPASLSPPLVFNDLSHELSIDLNLILDDFEATHEFYFMW